jgi:peptidoglycan-associated lipoprotein
MAAVSSVALNQTGSGQVASDGRTSLDIYMASWRSKHMIKRIFTLVAAAALLAACETASTTDSSATGSTTASTSTGTSTAATSTATTTVAETPEDPAEVMKREFTKVGTTVLFDFDSSQLSDYARRVLDRQAGFLKAQPEARIILGGHADERGTREYNLALGERRAAAARDYLVAKGVNAARIRIISYGKERPVAVGSNEAAWRLNRRAESVLN